MRKGIAYLRVSTELQDIDRQRKLIEDYCKKNEVEVVKWIQEKISGSKSDRIGLMELMQCSDEIADIVIIADMSRFSRQDDLIQVVANIGTVLQNGLDLIFINKPDKIYKANTQLTMQDIIILIVEAYSNAVERVKIVERLTTQKDIMMQKNPYSYISGELHFGYKVIDNPDYNRKQIDGKVARKIIVEDEENAQIVKDIFRMSSERKSIYEITRWLNANGMECIYSWVSKLLSNKIYKGERLYNNKIYHIKPLIEPEIFNKVQIIKKQNRDRANNSRTEFNPFKGLIFCGHCGRSLHLQLKDERVKNARSSYICNGKNPAVSGFKDFVKCESSNITKQNVWDAVLFAFLEEVGLDFSLHVKPAIRQFKADIEDKNITLQSLQTRIKKNEKSMGKIAKTLLDCDIDSLKQRYKSQYIETENKNKALQTQIKNLETEIAKLSLKIDDLKKTSTTRCLTEKEIAEQFRTYIDKVLVYTADKKKNFVVVHFNNGKEYVLLATKSKLSTWTAKLTTDYHFNAEKITCICSQDNKEYTFSELEDMAKKQKIFDCCESSTVVEYD